LWRSRSAPRPTSAEPEGTRAQPGQAETPENESSEEKPYPPRPSRYLGGPDPTWRGAPSASTRVSKKTHLLRGWFLVGGRASRAREVYRYRPCRRAGYQQSLPPGRSHRNQQHDRTSRFGVLYSLRAGGGKDWGRTAPRTSGGANLHDERRQAHRPEGLQEPHQSATPKLTYSRRSNVQPTGSVSSG